MDINLGKIGVTALQISNSHALAIDPIKGFGHSEDEVVVVATRNLTDEEKLNLINSLKSIPNTDINKEARKNRKKDIVQKLGLSKQEIRSLSELIQDGNDD
jgi:hypothetical protein